MKTWYAIMEEAETERTFKVPLNRAYFFEEALDRAILNTQIFGDTCYIKDIKRGNYFEEAMG